MELDKGQLLGDRDNEECLFITVFPMLYNYLVVVAVNC